MFTSKSRMTPRGHISVNPLTCAFVIIIFVKGLITIKLFVSNIINEIKVNFVLRIKCQLVHQRIDGKEATDDANFLTKSVYEKVNFSFVNQNYVVKSIKMTFPRYFDCITSSVMNSVQRNDTVNVITFGFVQIMAPQISTSVVPYVYRLN